jgi:uncharacterized protein (DUF1501 family)
MLTNDQINSFSVARRNVLKKSLGWTAGMGIAQSFALNLHGIAHAAAAPSDYRSLVCVFLFGGNDHANTLIPFGDAEWAAYVRGRSGASSVADLAGARAKVDLRPIAASKVTDQQLSLPKELSSVANLYDNGKIAIVANVGPLQQPMTRQEYENTSVSLPQQLFSHLDNQNYWQSSMPSFSQTGWGGRLADLLVSANGASPLSMCMSLWGSNLMQTGTQTSYFPLTQDGVVPNQALAARFKQIRNSVALSRMLAAPRQHPFEQEYAKRMARSVTAEEVVYTALQTGSTFADDFKSTAPDGNTLMGQLQTVARMINARVTLGQRRQVFFVGLGGFDSHVGLDDSHRLLLVRVNEALAAFYKVIDLQRLTDSVLTFTASDFGRCLLTNNRGSDHGWGGHHFVMGGGVKGGNVHGRMPTPGLNGPEDAGQGRLIPSTSVDQYSAEIARWFGVASSDIPLVLPNIGRFDRNALTLF